VDISHNASSDVRLHGYYVFQRDRRQGAQRCRETLFQAFGDTRQSHRQIATFNVSPNYITESRKRRHDSVLIASILRFTPNSLLNPADFGIANGHQRRKRTAPNQHWGHRNQLRRPTGLPHRGRGDTTVVFADNPELLCRGRQLVQNLAESTGVFYFNQFQQRRGDFLPSKMRRIFASGQPNTFIFSPGNNPSPQ